MCYENTQMVGGAGILACTIANKCLSSAEGRNAHGSYLLLFYF